MRDAEIDAHIGARLRLLRKGSGVTQAQLGQVLGVTFQQVQKYETGRNRLSTSKLYYAAQALGVSVQAFYDGLPGAPAPVAPAVIARRELRLLRAWRAIADAHTQRKLLELIEEWARLIKTPPAD